MDAEIIQGMKQKAKQKIHVLKKMENTEVSSRVSRILEILLIFLLIGSICVILTTALIKMNFFYWSLYVC